MQIILVTLSRHPSSFNIRSPGQFIVFTRTFPAMVLHIAVQTRSGLFYFLQCFQIQNSHINRIHRRTSIIQIQLISFYIKGRVPIRPDFLDLLPFSQFRLIRTIKHSFTMRRTYIINIIVLHHNSGCIIFYRQHRIRYHHMCPCIKVKRIPITGRLRRKQ